MRGTIRRAEPEDVSSLEIVRRQAVEHGLTEAYDRSQVADLVARPDSTLRERIDAPPSEVLVLVVETDVTTVCYGVYDRREHTLRGLYTAPDYQRHGCASALLDRFEDVARDDGATTVDATVPRNAVSFFEARGYERDGAREWRGLRCLRVAKRLDRAGSRDG